MTTSRSTKYLFLSFFLLVAHLGSSQDRHLSSQKGTSTLGPGIGLPYGAIGIRFGTNPIDGLNIFGGLGYQLSGPGYNFGLLKDFASSRMTQFYLVGMYGTNAAIKIKGLPEYDRTYTGGTFGPGIKINSRRTEGNFWDIGLLLPIRSREFEADELRVKNDPRIAEFTPASPVLITLGYNFRLR